MKKKLCRNVKDQSEVPAREEIDTCFGVVNRGQDREVTLPPGMFEDIEKNLITRSQSESKFLGSECYVLIDVKIKINIRKTSLYWLEWVRTLFTITIYRSYLFKSSEKTGNVAINVMYKLQDKHETNNTPHSLNLVLQYIILFIQIIQKKKTSKVRVK